jgi:hypothetical protein
MSSITLSFPEALTVAVGLLLALIVVIIPAARKWFTSISSDSQSLITGGLVMITAIAAISANCLNFFGLVICHQEDVITFILRIVLATLIGVGASRGVFLLARVVQTRRGNQTIRQINGARPKLFE